MKSEEGEQRDIFIHCPAPVLKVDNIVCETSNRNGPLRQLVALVLGASMRVDGGDDSDY